MSVPGLDATHTWNGGAVVLQGDHEEIPEPPYYLIRKIENWRSLPDTTLVADPAQGRPGEIPRNSNNLGKTVAYDGLIVARNPSDLRSASDALVSAFWDLETGEMVVDPLMGSDSYFYRARRASLTVTEEFTVGPNATRSRGWERPFVLSLRMDDARFYSTIEVSAQSGTAPGTTTGGVPWSWTAGGVSGWATTSVGVNVTNSGLADADPVLELHGPSSGGVTAPRVANWLTKTGLRFSDSLTIAAGEYLTIDFARTSCVLSSSLAHRDGWDVDPYRIADYSDWWDDGVPGLLRNAAQELRYGGKTVGSGMRLVVKFNPPRY